jgi:hypothetical protein
MREFDARQRNRGRVETLQAEHARHRPDLDTRQSLAARNAHQQERLHAPLRALQQERGEVERLREQLDTAIAPAAAAAAQAPAGHLPDSGPDATTTSDPALADRVVLCVGGRTSSVPVYRRLVESQGARFLHHDGGEEQGSGQLESTLATADLVICQAGCVSHNAYWRVKDQ